MPASEGPPSTGRTAVGERTPPVRVVVFDVNETLSDMRPLASRFTDVGAPEHLAAVWFSAVLRDGFALTSVGESATFAALGREGLAGLFRGVPLTRDLAAAIDHVMTGFASLGLHPDVAPGVRALRATGVRLVTLSNGAASVAERLLSEAGIRQEFDHVLTVEDAGIWKPAAGAYAHAARRCGTSADAMLMVAVHPWDLHGAARAGLRTAWVDRDGGRYPGTFATPDHVVRAVADLVGVIRG
jgi:2-haloacid dehalogenase